MGPTMQQNQQSRQDFNRMTNQRTQAFQQRQQNKSLPVASPPMTPEERLLSRGKQQQLEQEANEQYARLVQAQQSQRQEHPAATPQLAAARQQADDRQLTRLAVTNYREVFLTGQLIKVNEAQELSSKSRLQLSNLSDNLLNDTWWSNQEGAPLIGKIKAYRDTLTSLTTGLLGFELAAPPAAPASLSTRPLEDLLAKDAFDPNAATQLLRDAALVGRLRASEQLVKAVQDFNSRSTAATASLALQNDPQKLRKELQKSLNTVNKEMARYHTSIYTSDEISVTVKALQKATATYLAKSSN